MKLYVDLETRSRQDLKVVGVYRYSECPDFRILMASYAWDDDPVQTLLDQDDISKLVDEAVYHNAVIVAHNAQFERVCLSRLVQEPGTGFLSPERFHDTMAVAGEHGLPQSLDGAARAVGAQLKDSAGSALIRLFCVPRRDGGWNDESTHPMEWLDFIAYCEQDVETLRDLDQRLGDFPNEAERRVWIADQLINDNGIRIDPDLCQRAVAAGVVNKEIAETGIAEVSTIMNPRSVPQMMKWVKEQGLQELLPNMQAETLQNAFDSGLLTEDQQTVLELRADAALTSSGKFATALAVASPDDRVRGGFHFFGAHTGRWAGRAVQLQNLPRDHFVDDATQLAAMLDLQLGLGAAGKTLRKLVRPAFLGPFTVCDYAAIEARVVAWLAGEVWALDAFRDGRDIYLETAARMGPTATRAHGKIAVLALGYNGAVNSLRAMGGGELVSSTVDSRLKEQARGGSLGAARASRLDLEDGALIEIVRQWRKTNARIVRLWANLDNAIEDGGPVGEHLSITRDGDAMKLWLPSGRAIHYYGVKWGERKTYSCDKQMTTDLAQARKWRDEGKDVKVSTKKSWSYRSNSRGGGRIQTYGGRLTENATQAVARDIMAEALVRLLDRGYTVAGHIHDEILVEGEHDPHEIAAIMCEQPKWADGLPIAAEGEICQRYKKM